MGPDPKKIAALEEKMKQLGILRQDLEEKFVKSSGRGGQKLNKSSSAVFIRHKPTGLTVKTGKHRSQHLNRFIALRTLVEKIEAGQDGTTGKALAKQEKLRKQKLRRKRRSRKRRSTTGLPLLPEPSKDE